VFVLVCYDIVNDARRAKVNEALEGYGVRVQRSVFECDVRPEQLAGLRGLLAQLVQPAEDSIRYYTLCRECVDRVVIQGQGAVYRDPPVYIV
jgi:CRISPR-associated protein Cas2